MEGILALHDPALRKLYDLKVRRISISSYQNTEFILPSYHHRYLFNVILISCLRGAYEEMSRNEDAV